MPVPESETGPPPILTSIAAFAAAFVATAALLHAALPNPLTLHADVRSEKLAMLQQWHGTVFSSAFGSSHVHNAFDPRVFDQTLAETALATRSANLAIEGGSQAEQRVMALQFLKQLESPAEVGAPAQPCFVLLELGAGANFTNDHLVHPRAINIYDLPTTRFITHLVTPRMPRRERFGRPGYALAAAALHYSNIGMLSNLIFHPPLNRTLIAQQTADDRRGQLAEPDSPVWADLIQRSEKTRPTPLPHKPFPLTPGSFELIAQLAAASPVRNVSFVYFELPVINDIFTAFDLPDHLTVPTGPASLQVPVINLAQPGVFPQLYDPSLWYDDAHLTSRGAQLASALLADQLKLWYAAHGGPAPCGGADALR